MQNEILKEVLKNFGEWKINETKVKDIPFLNDIMNFVIDKARTGSTQIDVLVIRRLTRNWNTERDKIGDEWQWCLEHKFELEAKMKYELKEQLQKKIFELEDIIEGL